MTFLHTTLALAGIASIAIPIVIHLLFRQRRKPVPWGAMRFLLEALRKQRRRLRLETILLLLTRCLLLACLAAAIARPILSGAGLLSGPAGRDVYLLIDNSLASSLRDDIRSQADTSAIERHKQSARAVIDSLGVNDRVGLVSLGGPAEALVVPASRDAGAVRALVDALAPTDGHADMAGAMDQIGSRLRAQREGGATESDRQSEIVVLSDFTLGSADLARPLPASLQGLDGLTITASRPAAAAPSNVQVVSIEPLRSVVLGRSGPSESGGAESSQVRVALRRSGAGINEPGVTTVRVRAGDGSESTGNSGVLPGSSASAQAQVKWNAGQVEAGVTLQVDAASSSRSEGRDAGERVLTAEIDRDAVAADNTTRRVVEVRDRLQVGVVAQRTFGSAGRIDALTPADWYRLALRPGDLSPIEITDIEPAAVDAPALSLLDAVVIPSPDLLKEDAWQKLRRFADAGGLVIASPPEAAVVHLWTDAFIKSMGLPWKIAREAARGGEGGARLEIGGQAGAGSTATDGSTIFTLLAPELKELAAPVRVLSWLKVEDDSSASRVLLSVQGGGPWMIAARAGSATSSGDTAPSTATSPSSGRGLVVFLASAPTLTWTDLPARPLMLPLMQELVRQGVGETGSSMSAIAGRGVMPPAGTVELRPVSDPSASARPVDSAAAAPVVVRHAGVWRSTDAAGRARGLVVVNADSDAGRLDVQSADAVRGWLAATLGTGTAPDAPAGAAVASEERVAWLDARAGEANAAGAPGGARSPWALPLFIAALALAVLEVFLARWFSHAWAGSEQPAPVFAAPNLDEVIAPAAKGAAA